jgi:modulator of FtsH protease HflK
MMMWQKGNPPGGFGDPRWKNAEKKLEGMISWLDSEWKQRPGIVWGGLLGIIILIWLLSGIYTVGPGYAGVVRTFGAVQPVYAAPGLNYRLPWPIQRVDVVSVEEIRTTEIGFRIGEQGRFMDVKEEALMLTSDENIIDIQAIVHYRVLDPGKYHFKVKDPDRAVKQAAEVSLRGVVGSNTIDYTMVEARAAVESRATEFLQALLDSYETGILIIGLKLQEVDAPIQVRDAFHDVVRAREDMDRLRREAEGYAADILPRARGRAAQLVAAAEAYKEQRRIRAEGDAVRFLHVLGEYEKAPFVTRQRLYLEVMERILPEVHKIILDPKGTPGVVPLLPLADMGGWGTASPAERTKASGDKR